MLAKICLPLRRPSLVLRYVRYALLPSNRRGPREAPQLQRFPCAARGTMGALPSLCAGMLIFAGLSAAPAHADEGMWTYRNFPSALLKQKYGVDIGAAWLERVQHSTIRLSNCTASFVSAQGLILTNHHCAESCLAEHSSRDKSLVEEGFMAHRREDELRCGTQVADVLMSVEEITPAITAVTRNLSDREANDIRKKTLTRLESECEQRSKLKCESVDLYDGAQYFLYKYRRYDDVRLVFAPEADIAAFGGDPDNFQFPRWCLDMSVLRAYDRGQPAATPVHLSVDFAGPTVNEAVFVSGHPGSTNRQLTVAQLEFMRDVQLPRALLLGSELRGRYIQFGKTGPAAQRIVQAPLNMLENSLKVRRKLLDALHDHALLYRKKQDEAALRARVLKDPKLIAIVSAARSGQDGETADPWADIAHAVQTERALNLPYYFLESGAGFQSQLFSYARLLVRGLAERNKTNTERLREYTDANLPRLEQRLRAEQPVFIELEKLTLSFSLERMREWLSPDHPLVRELLGKESPDDLAAHLLDGSKLADPKVRLQLWKGGMAALATANDPMIKLAQIVDGPARALRKRYEDEIEAPVRSAEEKIARARFAALGTDVYPDANFTLRLNFGSVQGWIENGESVPPLTHLQRLFERATGQPPFRVPESWLKVKNHLDLATPFNLSTNNDIVGGNSGSPLLDAHGNIVGLIFDGNIHSIAGDYGFDADNNRAVAVHTAIIREALTKVYRADGLLKEMTAK